MNFTTQKTCFSSMAALLIGHSFHSKNCSIQQLKSKSKNCPTTLNTSIFCQSRLPVDQETEKGKEKEKEKEKKQLLPQVLVSVGNFGKKLKDNLSPKQKGDWKDLMLMSLSFAVYIYISQRIVCTYCAWMSMIKQPW
ncbi:hypothetical protein LOK49_LG02G01437 [Camellia lanceoleosa]|uniref:Uncharacterized protein n=1 Tax=Camellia lanceoleosa TaxID=1840588 RepID=A0ACC0IKF1_9ERIC|nr:hypothetical protein LOK49_LG02G01437 [Camellia lanceoleosa]